MARAQARTSVQQCAIEALNYCTGHLSFSGAAKKEAEFGARRARLLSRPSDKVIPIWRSRLASSIRKQAKARHKGTTQRALCRPRGCEQGERPARAFTSTNVAAEERSDIGAGWPTQEERARRWRWPTCCPARTMSAHMYTLIGGEQRGCCFRQLLYSCNNDLLFVDRVACPAPVVRPPLKEQLAPGALIQVAARRSVAAAPPSCASASASVCV